MDQQLYIKRLSELIAINSVYDQSTVSETRPFGKGISQVFQKMSEFAIKDGLNVRLIDNKTLEISNHPLATSNDIGILGHLDVVVAGDLNKWETNPFELTIKNGDEMYGRGVIDDKGPTLLAYQAAMQVIKDNKNNGKTIRIILGGAEETTWDCMKSYFKDNPAPAIAFTPDSSFPVVNGEKGITNCEIILENIKFEKIKEFETPQAINIVPNYAKVKIENQELVYHGHAVHSSLIEKGENAIYKMFSDLRLKQNKLGITNDLLKIKPLLDIFINDDYLDNLDCNIIHPKLGKSTSNLAAVNYDLANQRLTFKLSYRLSYGLSLARLYNKLEEKVGSFAKVKRGQIYFEAFYYDEELPVVKKLLDAYNQVMGENEKPICAAGTTYAKAIKNCVAFGAGFKGQQRRAHEENECAKLSDFMKGYQIYYQAIINLCQDE